MRARRLCSLPLLFAGLWTGCATVPAAGPDQPRDPYAEARREIALHPDVPDQWFMLPDVELVGYQYTRSDSVRRDTVQGAAEVSIWLRSHEVRTRYEDQPFRLQVREVLVCDSSAVERGWVHIPRRMLGVDRPGVSRRTYLAQWRPRGEAWKLSRLFISPPAALRANDLATSCTAAPVLPPGVGFGVALGAGSAGDLDAVRGDMAAEGFSGFTQSGAGRPEARIWAGLDLSAWFTGRLSLGLIAPSRVEGVLENVTQPTTEEIAVQSTVLSLVGEARLGPVRIGAGPAIAFSRISWSRVEEFNQTEIFTNRDDWVNPLGAVARASVHVPISPTFTALAAAGYDWFPDLDPPHAGIPAPITVRTTSLVLGLELRP
ncbi:MAG: hypothetical protein R3314_03865 [Longimicrobiales bacterium]|nr:hypothetical protein [Longimicrobiales bacterium]